MNLGKWIINSLFLSFVFLVIGCSPSKTDEELLSQAIQYQQEGKIREAIIELKNTLQTNAKNAEARYLLGQLSLEIGDPAAAEKEFRKALQHGWNEEEAVIGLLKAKMYAGDFGEILDGSHSKKIYSDAANANIYGIIASAHLAQGEAEQAKAALEMGAALDASAVQLITSKIRYHMIKGESENAASLLVNALQNHPKNRELILLAASISLNNDDLSAAEARYLEIIDLEPKQLVTAYGKKARLGLANIAIYRNDLEKAEEYLRPMHKSMPKDPELNFIAGQLAFKKQNFDEAEERLLLVMNANPDHARTHLFFGMVNFAQQDFEQAAYYIEKYLDRDPTNVAVRKLLGRTFMLLEQNEKAQDVLEPAMLVQSDKIDPELLAMIGLTQFKQGDSASGIQGLEKAFSADPTSRTLRNELVKAYIASGETDKAIEQLDNALTLNPDDEQSEVLLITAYLRSGEYNNAINKILDMLKSSPDNVHLNTLAGIVFSAASDFEEASKYFENAIRINPAYELAYLSYGKAEEIQGNLAKAEELYRTIASKEQVSSEPYVRLASIANINDNADATVNWLEQGLKQSPDNTRLAIMLGDFYLRNGNIASAQGVVEEHLSSVGNDHAVKFLKARIMIANDQHNKSVSLLNEAVNAAPNNNSYRIVLAENYLALNQPEEAIKELDQVLSKQSYSFPAILLMSQAKTRLGEFDEALSYALEAQKFRPDSSLAHELEGNVWFSKKDFRQAALAYDKAWQVDKNSMLTIKYARAKQLLGEMAVSATILAEGVERHPNNFQVRQVYATTLESLGRHPEAIKQYERILKQEPNNATALNNIAWLYSLQGNENALSYAEKAYQLSPEDPGIMDTYGWLLLQSGEVKQGKSLIGDAYSVLSDVPEVKYHYSVALYKNDQPAEAETLLVQLLGAEKNFMGKEEAEKLLDTLRKR